jgi:hypothetical protein
MPNLSINFDLAYRVRATILQRIVSPNSHHTLPKLKLHDLCDTPNDFQPLGLWMLEDAYLRT